VTSRGAQSNTVRVSIFPILAVNFVGTLGFSIVLPFLVFLVTKWGGNALIYGLVGATYSAFQLIGAPILGRWSDVHGRRKILLLSQLGTLASWVLFVVAFALPSGPIAEFSSRQVGSFALTLPLVLLFVARAFDGLTGGNVSVANAYLADISTDENRNANFGKMSVSANIGFVLGPAIAGVLGGTAIGELLPVLAALAVSAVASVIIAVALPESNPCILKNDPAQTNVHKVLGPDQKPCYQLEGAGKLSFRDVLRLPRLPVLLAIYFLVMLGFNFFYVSFPMYAVRGLEWSVRNTGIFFSVLSILMVIVQGPILSRVSRRVNDRLLALIGGFVLAISFPFIGTGKTAVIYGGAALLALGNGLMWPSIVSILSKAAGDRYQGAVQGIASSCGAVASILGLLVGGLLFDVLEARTFLVSAGIILVASVLSLRMLSWREAKGGAIDQASP
jgi:MFS family permease